MNHRDRVFSPVFLKTLPVTNAQYVAVGVCFALNLLLSTASAFNLSTLSAVFTITFLSTLLMVRASSATTFDINLFFSMQLVIYS